MAYALLLHMLGIGIGLRNRPLPDRVKEALYLAVGLTVAQVIPGAQAIVVTTPQEVSLLDIRKSITFCRRLGMRVFGIIENMSGLTCPYCGKKIDLFSAGGGERTAREMTIPFLGKIPIKPQVITSGDKGEPYVLLYPDETDFSPIIERIMEGVKL